MSTVTEKTCVQSNDQKPNSRLRGSPHSSWSPMTITPGDRDFCMEAHRKHIKMRRGARASLRPRAQVVGLAPPTRGERCGRGGLGGGAGATHAVVASLVVLVLGFYVNGEFRQKGALWGERKVSSAYQFFLSSRLQLSLWMRSWPSGCDHCPQPEMLRH